MKKFFVIAALFFGSVGFVAANVLQTTTISINTEVDENAKKIEFTQLPEVVQAAFKSSDLKDAAVKEVYEITKTDSKIYKIVVTIGAADKTVKYNDKGELLKD